MNRQDFTSDKVIIRHDADLVERLERVESLLYAMFTNSYSGVNPEVITIPLAGAESFIDDYRKSNPEFAKEIDKDQLS